MGRRDDDFLDDERADAALRRVLARLGELDQVAHPPDLVTRTARRLPVVPPAAAVRAAARSAALRLALDLATVAALSLVALLGIWSALAGQDRIAMLFGDGGGGLSRALLTLQLLAKPLLRTVGSVGPLLLAGAAAVAGAGWLWWLLLQRTPVQYAESAQ